MKVYKIQILIREFQDPYLAWFDVEWQDWKNGKIYATKELAEKDIKELESKYDYVFAAVAMEFINE